MTQLRECPFCGGTACLTKGYAIENVWPHGTFYRVYCSSCQCRQLFHRTEEEAIAAWNRRAVPVQAEPATEERAYQIGTTGVPHTEQERTLFEAYMKGHCWATGPFVDGQYYEQFPRICYAVWRARAALSAAQAPDTQNGEALQPKV